MATALGHGPAILLVVVGGMTLTLMFATLFAVLMIVAHGPGVAESEGGPSKVNEEETQS